MKQTLKIISSVMLCALFCAIGLIILAVLLSGCSQKIVPVSPRPWEAPDTARTDHAAVMVRIVRPLSGTVLYVPMDSVKGARFVVDTLVLPGDSLVLRDTLPCPPGLTDVTPVTFTRTVLVPGRAVEVPAVPFDTVYLPATKPASASHEPVFKTDIGWGERGGWISALLLLLFGFFRQWRNKNPSIV